MRPAEVWHHARYYLDEDSGEWMSKWLLILSVTRWDVNHRVLTSVARGRNVTPTCFHGNPYPYFYLGVPATYIAAPGLHLPTWLDLAEHDDIEVDRFQLLVKNRVLTRVDAIPDALFCEALTCVAGAPDTTTQQRQLILDERQARRCP